MSNIKIVATVVLKAEKRDELLAGFGRLVELSRQEAGNLRYDLHQDIQNPNRVVFFENWRDQAAIDAHNATEHFQGFLKAIEGNVENVDIILLSDVSHNPQ